MATHNHAAVPYLDLLPVETWTTILELLDAASLSSLCLVSSKFRTLAQHVLFQSISLLLPEYFVVDEDQEEEEEVQGELALYDRVYTAHKKKLDRLGEVLAQSPHLARAVLDLTVKVTEEADADFNPTESVLSLQVIQAMVNLKSLTLEGDMERCVDEEGEHVASDMLEVLSRTQIRKLVLHHPNAMHNHTCGLEGTQLAKFSSLEYFEWDAELPIGGSVQKPSFNDNPTRALLKASQETLTAINIPFYSDLKHGINELLCDLRFPQLHTLILGPYITSVLTPDSPDLDAKFTKFIDAHPLLELLDLGYTKQPTESIGRPHITSDSRPRLPKLNTKYLTSGSLPRLKRFRGNIESIESIMAISSLSKLEELGIAPATKRVGTAPEFGLMKSVLQRWLRSPSKPGLRVLHIDFRWDGQTGKGPVIEVLALCARLWGETLETWAGSFPLAIAFNDCLDIYKALEGFSKLQTVYLPTQQHIMFPATGELADPKVRSVLRTQSLARAIPTLERVRVEKNSWACPLAESRTRGLLRWYEWRVSRVVSVDGAEDEVIRIRKLVY